MLECAETCLNSLIEWNLAENDNPEVWILNEENVDFETGLQALGACFNHSN